MNFSNVAGVMQMAYQHANQTQKTSVNDNRFTDSLRKASGADVSKVEAYTEELRSKYGNVMIMNVGKDQSSMDNLGMGTAGYSNVVIAPNILEEMANDPEKAAYYEEKIQHHFDTIPETEAFMAAIGHVTISSGVVIHEDGSVTYYLSGEESPEKKAEFEAAQKEKREKKAAERKENLKYTQDAAEKRNLLLESQYRNHLLEQMSNGQVMNGAISFYITGQPQIIAPAVTAYNRAVSTLGSGMI